MFTALRGWLSLLEATPYVCLHPCCPCSCFITLCNRTNSYVLEWFDGIVVITCDCNWLVTHVSKLQTFGEYFDCRGVGRPCGSPTRCICDVIPQLWNHQTAHLGARSCTNAVYGGGPSPHGVLLSPFFAYACMCAKNSETYVGVAMGLAGPYLRHIGNKVGSNRHYAYYSLKNRRKERKKNPECFDTKQHLSRKY